MKRMHKEQVDNISTVSQGEIAIFTQRKAFILSCGFLLLLVMGLTALGLWFWYGSLEESVPGIGEMAPEGKIRRVMSPLNGMVVKVYAQEDQQVRAGQVLIELDPEPAEVETEGLDRQLSLLQAQEKALQAASSLSGDTRPPEATIPDATQNAWLDATWQAYRAQKAEVKMQIAKLQHNLNEAIRQKKQVQDVLKTSELLFVRYQKLYEEGGIPEKELQEYEQQVLHQRGQLAVLDESAKAARAELEQAKLRPEELRGNYQKEILFRLSEVQRQIAQLQSETQKTQLTMRRQYIKAPLDGIIHEQTVRGPGDVAVVGQALLSIVPSDAGMVAEVKVANRDLAYIHLNQRAALRLDAFPYQKFGRLYGTVESISPSTQQRSSTESEPEVPYYIIKIRPDKSSMSAEGVTYPFRSGMTLTADIITRKKNILSFFTEPINLHLDRAFRDPSNR